MNKENIINKKTTKYPLVSIIIPVYNGSNYMQEAIDSALQQTYSHIEIIVVNDGSTDSGKTERIALSYGNKIRYLTKKNGGVATALNMGIEHMNGSFFSWLSHDDVYYPEKVEYQIEYLQTINSKQFIVYSDFDIINSKSIITNHYHLNHDMLIKKPLYGILRGHIHGCSLLIPKEAFSKYGVFNTTLKFTQDYDLWLRLSKHYTFKHIDKTLIQSRTHQEQDSKVHSQNPKEGNTFWTKCVNELQDEVILQCESSKTIFYLRMAIHLKGTPYTKGYDYSKKLAYKESYLFAHILLQFYVITFYSKKILRYSLNRYKRLTFQKGK